MAVTSFNEIKDGQGGSDEIEGTGTITRSFRVTTDHNFDNPATIAPQLPLHPNDPHSNDSTFILHGLDFDREHKRVWIVTATYRHATPHTEEDAQRREHDNPLDRRAHVRVRSHRYERLTTRDRNGTLMVTSAGEPYPPTPLDDDRWTIDVTKNYGEIPSFVWDYQQSLNNAAVQVKGRTLAKETVRFADVDVSELKFESDFAYYTVQFQLEYRRAGWTLSRLDAGFHYIDGSGNYVPITIDGERPQVEQLLDGNGGLLIDSVPNPTGSDASYNDFEMYVTADFSVLPLAETNEV